MLNPLTEQLGPLAWPLLACSLLTAAILLERLVILTLTSLRRRLIVAADAILQQYQQQPKSTREEVLSVWLGNQQQQLASGIRLLQIVALVAPLLGLLGTVIGLIQVFDDLGQHRGPIEPALLADGLGIAMKTTAAGLLIAVPALLGAHGFQLWVDKLISHSQHQINLHNLQMEGVCIEALS